MRLFRLAKIIAVSLRFGLDEFILGHERVRALRWLLTFLLFWRRLEAPRAVRLRLALEALGQRSTLPPKPLPPTWEAKEVARKNSGLQRALYAIALGLRSEGVRGWNCSISRLMPISS